MSIIIRKAQRQKAKLRLGISAPSGCGKTMGALLLAYGITHDWNKIGMIDTEEGSGELYVGNAKHGVTIGDFNYIRIAKDFAPIHYKNAINAFEKHGVEVIIIDSLSHAWAGAGGLLEKQGKIADSSASKNSYTAWRTVTPEHNALVDAMLQSPCHIIATMRSKVEYAQVTGGDGKAKIVKLGLAPVQREGMEYEFTTFFDIKENCMATTTKDRTDLFSSLNAQGTLDKKEFIITPEIGKTIHDWLEQGGIPVNNSALIMAEITELLDTVKLDEAVAGDKWIIDRKQKLSEQNEETLNKILNYLKGK